MGAGSGPAGFGEPNAESCQCSWARTATILLNSRMQITNEEELTRDRQNERNRSICKRLPASTIFLMLLTRWPDAACIRYIHATFICRQLRDLTV
jgi:hypothetical protein